MVLSKLKGFAEDKLYVDQRRWEFFLKGQKTLWKKDLLID